MIIKSYPFHYPVYCVYGQLKDFAHKWDSVFSERKKQAILLDNQRLQDIIKKAMVETDGDLPPWWVVISQARIKKRKK